MRNFFCSTNHFASLLTITNGAGSKSNSSVEGASNSLDVKLLIKMLEDKFSKILSQTLEPIYAKLYKLRSTPKQSKSG